MLELAKDVSRHLYLEIAADPSAATKDLISWAKACAGVGKIRAMEVLARGMDGVIIDHFVLARPAGGDDDGLWTRVSRDIAAIVRGELRPDHLLARAQRRVPSAESVRLEIEPRIIVDNRSSEAYAIIDVICGDRVGLLYALATQLAADGLDIHFAKISTVGGMATDVFYVTDAASGRRLEDDARIESVRQRLLATCRDAQQARR